MMEMNGQTDRSPKEPAKRLAGDNSGATTLEWALLLGAIALPSYFIIRMALETLVEYYRMMTTLNGLPFP